MPRYRFLDAMGDVLTEGQFDDHDAAIAHAADGDADLGDDEREVNRVEFLGDQGDWRWAGPLQG